MPVVAPVALPPPHDPAVARAFSSAALVGGVMAELPCRFHLAQVGSGLRVVVACPPEADPAREVFVRERTLTAVQRLTLALWSEGVTAIWQPGAPASDLRLPDGVERDAVVGIVWCPAGAVRAEAA